MDSKAQLVTTQKALLWIVSLIAIFSLAYNIVLRQQLKMLEIREETLGKNSKTFDRDLGAVQSIYQDAVEQMKDRWFPLVPGNALSISDSPKGAEYCEIVTSHLGAGLVLDVKRVNVGLVAKGELPIEIKLHARDSILSPDFVWLMVGDTEIKELDDFLNHRSDKKSLVLIQN